MPGGAGSPLGQNMSGYTQMFFCVRLNWSATNSRKHRRRRRRRRTHRLPKPRFRAGRRPRAAISQNSSAAAPSRWPAVIRRGDFYGAPRWSHLSCDHLRLPPAIGQGSYNRRLGGGPGPPPRMLPQLSRCGEGAGRANQLL